MGNIHFYGQRSKEDSGFFEIENDDDFDHLKSRKPFKKSNSESEATNSNNNNNEDEDDVDDEEEVDEKYDDCYSTISVRFLIKSISSPHRHTHRMFFSFMLRIGVIYVNTLNTHYRLEIIIIIIIIST